MISSLSAPSSVFSFPALVILSSHALSAFRFISLSIFHSFYLSPFFCQYQHHYHSLAFQFSLLSSYFSAFLFISFSVFHFLYIPPLFSISAPFYPFSLPVLIAILFSLVILSLSSSPFLINAFLCASCKHIYILLVYFPDDGFLSSRRSLIRSSPISLFTNTPRHVYILKKERKKK